MRPGSSSARPASIPWRRGRSLTSFCRPASRRARVAIVGGCFALLQVSPLPAQTEPPHPILTISGSGSGASTILSTWTESQYTNYFTPRLAPRNDSYGFVPAVVSGDTDWSWSISSPNQIKSTPSGTIFPTRSLHDPDAGRQVLSGNTVNAPYYNKAGSTTSKSLVFNLIDYHKLSQLRSDFNKLAPAYINSGGSPATRNDAYARRIAVALLDWARWHPDYYHHGARTAPRSSTRRPSYILASDLQRASDHNGLAHEWADDELLAFDAIYDSVALTNLSTEIGFDVRDYIRSNLFCNEGDFIVNHVPVDVAIQSNLSGPYAVLPLVARVLNRPDYIVWMDSYLDATVRKKIRRDGALEEGHGLFDRLFEREPGRGAKHARLFSHAARDERAAAGDQQSRIDLQQHAHVRPGPVEADEPAERPVALVRRHAVQQLFLRRTAPAIPPCCPLTARLDGRRQRQPGRAGESEFFRRQQPHALRHDARSCSGRSTTKSSATSATTTAPPAGSSPNKSSPTTPSTIDRVELTPIPTPTLTATATSRFTSRATTVWR